MHSVQTGLWNPRPPFKHVFPIPAPPPSNSRPAHVTSTTPAKRITFYKSGDSQFGGVRMAIHKRSFKCFDALLDDLSQKVPLPFGVRTVTTPRGTHTIKHLEQLQDGGCYLCSDRRQAKPVNMELVSKHSGIWYNHNRRPQRPETSSATPPGHLHMPYRQRRILLVKNSEPGMRRSVVLSRRTARSLRAFLDEVSEVMQFHVRKLYTVEGRRIDSIQSLMTCPGMLVCVGREAFSPLLINFIRKSSEEKLPGLGPRTPGNGARSPATQGVRSPPHGAQSRASEYSEGHESKKNVNFGLETKKSIIHPRSDSSSRSARFSFSSEKSYGNGLTACSQAKPAIMNDDIEKRVLVNKDGSLSVEMRVRFRLQNDETLQWSTQIKKSPSLSNEFCPLSQAQPHYLQQGQSESCSDPDSTSFDRDGIGYSSQPLQCELEGNRCPCCHQRHEQQYDLWENPAHSHKSPPVPPPHASSRTHAMVRHTHSSSSSSSCNSRRVVRCRARLSSCRGGSGSEQSQLVQEEMCVTEQVEHTLEVEQDGDTHIEVHKVSRCCSRSEVVVSDSNLQPLSRKSAEDEEDRPPSAVSSSSHVLRSLKEDEDDEDDDLPPSISRCCHNEPSPTPETQLHEKPTNGVSANSFHSTKPKEQEELGSRAVSAASSCLCGETATCSAGPNEVDQVPFTTSKISVTSMPESEERGACDDDEGTKRAVTGLSGHTGLSASSQKSVTSSVCPNCGGCKRKVDSVSGGRELQRTNRSNQASPLPISDDAASDVSTQSNKTNLTNNGRLSATSNILEGKVSSAMSRTSSPQATQKEKERAPSATSATSHRSNRSHNSGCKHSTDISAKKEDERSSSVVSNQSAKSNKSKHTNEAPVISSRETAEGENTVERAVSSLSAKSCVSAETDASLKSCNSTCQSGTKGTSRSDNPAVEEHDPNNRAPSSLSVKSKVSAKAGKAERPDSAASRNSNISVKSSTSQRSTCSNCAKATGVEATIKVTGKGTETEVEERPTSAMSSNSNLSAKYIKSQKSTKASEAGGEGEERAPSQMSVKSGKSAKSTKSFRSNCDGNEMVTCSSSKTADVAKENSNRNTESDSEIVHNTEKAEERAASILSHKSAFSAKSPSTKIEGDDMVDRAPSAKSSKSQNSNQTTASPVPSEAKEIQERVESVMSAKSKSSVRANISHKSNSSANVVTIKTPAVDDEENVTNERAPSAASEKSNVSSTVSQKSNCNGKTDIAIIETADGDKKVTYESTPKIKTNVQTLSPKRTRSPRMRSPDASAATTTCKSPVQQLLNGSDAGETRGPSVLSVHSVRSAKSGKSRCCCGAASEFDEAKTEKENKDKEVKLEVKSENASERAASALSSRGTDQLLSQNSTESVSLGLPEETSDSDSGKSSVCVHRSAESNDKGQAKTPTPSLPKSPEVTTTKEDVEITGSTVSQKSNRAGRKSGSAVDIPTIETPSGEENGLQKTEKAASTISVRSSRSNRSSCICRSKEKHANASSTKVGNGNETEIMKSASVTNGSNDRNSSAMSSASVKVQNKSCAKAIAKTVPGKSENNDTENQENTSAASQAKQKEDTAFNKTISPQSPFCFRAESAALASDQSKEKDQVECKSKFSTGSDRGSVKMASSLKKETLIKSSSPCPLHSKVETCSESTLSQSLSAADLLKETMAAARPCSQQSKASKTSDKSRSKKSGMCQRSSNQKDKREELTPACLPNTSPSEVVSDWLRSIPANSSMLALGDEFNEEELRTKETEEIPGGEIAQESPEGEKIEVEEKGEPEKDEEKEDEAKCELAQEEKGSDPTSGDAEGTSGRPGALLLQSEALPRSWQSSAAVMKVLLSSSLGRCRSMPEVSPVYGRRLSTSARGLLDCLAQLQLIEPALGPGCELQKCRSQQYEDIMAILHSLWLTEPGIIEAKEAKENKNSSPQQVTPPRSSSGVGMSSGSAGSGKENGNQGGDETPPKERESLHAREVAENIIEEEEEGNAMAGDTEIATEHKETFTDQAKADTAEEPVQSEEAPQKSESSKPSESSDKSSAKDGSKSPTDNERETLEESSTGTPPTVLRAPLAKRLSQDPDPVWVLHLLKKLEKQFMDHYVNAMAEFKVRWDLDDSLILDTMICELRDEVSQRIQSSIEREMRKIQGRAGRGGRSPRPPQGTNLSRESTTTEKRRQMLKIMKKQSVKTGDSLSDGEMTGEFSDQRSDDEYCPCEACVRKKMAARPFKTNPLAADAPVIKDFDLLKILQLKKSPALAPATVPQHAAVEDKSQASVDDDGRNLDVVQEEEEEDETKEDISAAVVLEETIAAEDEEAEKENGDGKAREEEETRNEQEENEESGASKEEQEEEETSGEEVREDETSETGEEEEEHQCECARNEEESDQEEEEEEEQTGEDEEETGEDETEENEGDTGTAEEEETSDQDTVKEASVGKGETPENGESDERVDDKDKTTDGESEEEEDDSAAETTENEKATLSKEAADSDVRASAEGEDDEEDGTGEGESSEEREWEASEEERTSPQDAIPAVCTTEGEEADAEDSDIDTKRSSDTAADKSGSEEKEESGEDRDEEEDAVKDLELEEEDKANGSKREDGALLHQFTRASVESQPGSLDDIDTESPQNPVDSIEVPKMANSISTGGSKGQRRSRSPARVKQLKPKEGEDELDSF